MVQSVSEVDTAGQGGTGHRRLVGGGVAADGAVGQRQRAAVVAQAAAAVGVARR